MSPLLSILSFWLFISATQSQEISTDPSYYYNLCAPSTCGNFSLSYPFNLPTRCHPYSLLPYCINNQSLHLTTTTRSFTDTYKILSVNFTDPVTTVFYVASDALFTCGAKVQRPNINNSTSSTMFKKPFNYLAGTHLNCTSPLPSNSFRGLQNASCIGCEGEDAGNFCYYAPGHYDAPNCVMYSVNTPGDSFNATRVQDLRRFLQLGYELRYDKSNECRGCEVSGGRCGARPTSDGSFVCFCPSSVHRNNCSDGMVDDLSTWVNAPSRRGSRLSKGIIAAISAFALALIVGVIVTLVVIFRCRRKCDFHLNKDTISSMSLRRYSYSQLKKFTNNFSSKLGEGGFGNVYKGIIHQKGFEVEVAIKILKDSRHSKKQFMNEVAIIGSVHHNNLVSILGYCVEGKTHALVYEFMENGSLDKYIYTIKEEKDGVEHDGSTYCKGLSVKQVYNIALDIARGILYLHESCRNKILHCDIKPSNVLVDNNFFAKVSDFGLARMVDEDHSHVSLTTAQGTPGYAAPEMWLKTYGPITTKSDVYGYGMLLLEMVGRRKNYDPETFSSSQVYFPEWIYNKIERYEFSLLTRKGDVRDFLEVFQNDDMIDDEDEKVVRRMSLVGLWCIQHLPSKRPSMDNIVHMLEGHTEISIPPHPFPLHITKNHDGPRFSIQVRNLIKSMKRDEIGSNQLKK